MISNLSVVLNVGEVSETHKRELEANRSTIDQQQNELTELRQQLAKLSEIVDRQTDDMKQLNIEARSVIQHTSPHTNSCQQHQAKTIYQHLDAWKKTPEEVDQFKYLGSTQTK